LHKSKAEPPEPVRRLEVFAGAGRRRRWTAEQKGRIVAESYEGGACCLSRNPRGSSSLSIHAPLRPASSPIVPTCGGRLRLGINCDLRLARSTALFCDLTMADSGGTIPAFPKKFNLNALRPWCRPRNRRPLFVVAANERRALRQSAGFEKPEWRPLKPAITSLGRHGFRSPRVMRRWRTRPSHLLRDEPQLKLIGPRPFESHPWPARRPARALRSPRLAVGS
jgi:Transposase